MPVVESRTALVCLVPLHCGRCVRPVACFFKDRVLCHDLSDWVEKLACRHCGESCSGSGQGQLLFCEEPDQYASQFLSRVHSNRTDAVPCGCGRAVSFSQQVFKQRHYHSFALVSVALGIFICVSAGWLARVPVCDHWGGLWRQTCAFPHACLVHSSFCILFFFFFFSRYLRSVSLVSYSLLCARMTSKEFTGLAQTSVLFHVDILPSCRESPARMLVDIKFCLLFQFLVSCDWTH